MLVRDAAPSDAEAIAGLLRSYLQERFPDHPGATAEQVNRDVLSSAGGQRILLAANSGELVGFVAWDRVYDLHWAAVGAQIADLYVTPRHRGQGIAIQLIAHVGSRARAEGATFLRGQGYDRSSPVGRLYERFAVGWPSAECRCGGRALNALADLAGRPIRELIAHLPPKEWNFVS